MYFKQLVRNQNTKKDIYTGTINAEHLPEFIDKIDGLIGLLGNSGSLSFTCWRLHFVLDNCQVSGIRWNEITSWLFDWVKEPAVILFVSGVWMKEFNIREFIEISTIR